jgi:ribosomal-protein-alanine N-acetyltransferase
VSPTELAALHLRVFVNPRPWTAAEFAALLESPLCFLIEAEGGFALGRVVAGEAELLTIAVAPERQGRGVGRQLMAGFLAEAQSRAAESVFLEVAETNAPARALYQRAGFAEAGRRRGYYEGIDAVVMMRQGLAAGALP